MGLDRGSDAREEVNRLTSIDLSLSDVQRINTYICSRLDWDQTKIVDILLN